MAEEDDDVWKSIVDNYGDRPELDEPEPPEPPAPPVPSYVEEPHDELTVRSWGDPYPDSDWASDRFVPPEPPPLPSTTVDRQAAWAGVLGSPLLLIACVIFRVGLPQLLTYALVGAFVGGFLYLVVTMSREPRDPGDDGAVL